MKFGLCDTCKFWGKFFGRGEGCQAPGWTPPQIVTKNGEVVECDRYVTEDK